MNKVILCLFGFFLFPQLLTAQSLTQVIPIPNSSYALTHDGTHLWAGTSTGSKIYKLDAATGAKVDSFTAVTAETRGLAWDGTNLWGYQYKFGTTVANKDLIVKYSPTGVPLDTLFSPYEDYVGGMTYAAGYLWVSVYYTGSSANPTWIIKIDPVTNQFVDTIVTPGKQPQGLAYDGTHLYLAMDDNDGDPERIWKINPVTGDTVSSFPIPPYASTVSAFPKDMAFHNGFLYLVVGQSSTNRAAYKFDLNSSGTPVIQLSAASLMFSGTSIASPDSQSLTIYNTGSAPLTVDSIRFTDPRFSLSGVAFPFTIPNGGNRQLFVRFTPLAYQTYQGTLSVFNNDPQNLVKNVTLRGQGLLQGQHIAVTESAHNFGNVWVPAPTDGNAYWEFKIYNPGSVPLPITSMSLNSMLYGFTSPTIPFTIASSDSVEIRVVFKPSLQGEFKDTLRITAGTSRAVATSVALSGTGVAGSYTYGSQFWTYQIPANPNTTSQEWKVEGLKTINDINGDGIDEVIFATENYWIGCLDGAAAGENRLLWIVNTYYNNSNAGSIGQSWEYGVQDALQIASDLNGDGYNDVVAALGGGLEAVMAINGKNGQILWMFDDPVNYDKGDFEAVDVRRDFNNDGVPDVLASADGNQTGTGYKSIFLFNGATGSIIWQYVYPGPNPAFGKSVISIADVTGDGIPEAVAAVGNNTTSDLMAICINGANTQTVWTYPFTDTEPKELIELPLSATSSDVVVSGYWGNVVRLDGATGTMRWNRVLGGTSAINELKLIQDINSDGVKDIIYSGLTSFLICLSGGSGEFLWNYPMNYQYGVDVVPDLDGDMVEDVITGDQDGTVYVINGKGTPLIYSAPNAGDRIITSKGIKSVDRNASYDLVFGTRNGRIFCLSGGLNAIPVQLTYFTAQATADGVLLQWSTATETNNSGFAIERNSGKEWHQIGYVQGAGTVTEKKSYQYVDIPPMGSNVIQYRLKQINYDGSFSYSAVEEVTALPQDYVLYQNYPNPFNPETTIRFGLPQSGLVELKLYDVLGNLVSTLIKKEMEAGVHSFRMDGRTLAAGTYFYTLTANGNRLVKKLMLLK